ncbi:MAG: response regulator [Bacteroidales bacterium]|nr:response regulator [Bacteroidales bacterium]MCF8350053.1 response regulator [Bacteroidales bacterium]MCF8375003.1 response regulator [Bacteroidales bacterium]
MDAGQVQAKDKAGRQYFIQWRNGGYETTRKTREKNKDVVIIAQTAYASAANEKTALEAGCNAYITKPIYKHELFKLIKGHFPKMNME